MTENPYEPPQASLEAPPSTEAVENPHVLSRQLVGFVLWVGILSFVAGGPLGALVALVLGGITFADAWRSGIYKRAESKSFLNISPMGWGIAMALLFIVAYPVYVLNRNPLRTIKAGNGFFIATEVIGGIITLLFVANIVLSMKMHR